MIQTGTIAAVGVAFSKFAGYFFPVLDLNDENILFQLGSFKLYPAQLLAIVLIAFLTWTNTKGVKGGKWIQNIFTSTKIISLIGLIIAGIIFFKPEVWKANWSNAFNMQKISAGGLAETVAGVGIFGAIAASMVGSIFSSDAWNNVTFIAGEIKNPKRNIGLSLVSGHTDQLP